MCVCVQTSVPYIFYETKNYVCVCESDKSCVKNINGLRFARIVYAGRRALGGRVRYIIRIIIIITTITAVIIVGQ